MLLPLTESVKGASVYLSTLSSINIAKSMHDENNEDNEDSDEEEKKEEEEMSKSIIATIVTNDSATKETEEDHSGFHTADSTSDHLHRIITSEEKN